MGFGYLQIAASVMPLILYVGFFIVLHQRDKAERKLDRWRTHWHESRRWLAEFPDVADALDHLKAVADGTQGSSLSNLRDNMRRRRDAGQS